MCHHGNVRMTVDEGLDPRYFGTFVGVRLGCLFVSEAFRLYPSHLLVMLRSCSPLRLPPHVCPSQLSLLLAPLVCCPFHYPRDKYDVSSLVPVLARLIMPGPSHNRRGQHKTIDEDVVIPYVRDAGE